MTERKTDEKMNYVDEFTASQIHTLKFDFMTSLTNIVVAKVVSSLWMNKNIQKKIIRFHKYIEILENDWSQIEASVFTQVSELFLPISIKEKLSNLVPLVGKSILDWVSYNEFIFETNYYFKYSIAEEIGNIAWNARGKIDYAQTAKNILSNQNSSISDCYKYKLACTYCLENEIAILAPSVVGPCYLDSIKMDRNPMVYFWTAHITGADSKLYNQCYNNRNEYNRNESINEHIMQLLMGARSKVKTIFNVVPIKYMWNKLNEKEKARNIKYLIFKLHNQDLRYSLLNDLDYEMQHKVFKECSYTILRDILNDWLWGEYFLPTALHVLDIMNPSSYMRILEDINDEKNMNYQKKNKYLYTKYKSIFMQLWKSSSRHLKDFIFDLKDGRSLERLVTSSLSLAPDMQVIEVIFEDLNAEQKKCIIFGADGIKYCVCLIKLGRWDSLELIIKHTLSNEGDIQELKQNLINKARDIGIHLLKIQALDKIEQFISWVFKSKEEIDKFRQTLEDFKILIINENSRHFHSDAANIFYKHLNGFVESQIA